MNRLAIGIALSGVFHVAMMGWPIGESEALPKVNVNPGKTSVAVKLKTPSQPEPEPKPKTKDVPDPTPEPEKKVKEVERPAPDKPDVKKVAEKPEPQQQPEKKPEPREPRPVKPQPKKPEKKKEVEETQKPSVPKKGAKWVKKADYRSNPSPQYPQVSRERGEEGSVILRVRVGKDGMPLRVEVRKSSRHDRLDREAVETVENWEFTPAEHAGVTVESSVLIPIHFRLDK